MFLLRDDQKVPLSIQPVDNMQEPTTLPEGATAVWSSSDPTIVSVEADAANPLAAIASSVDDPGQVKFGTAQVNVVVTDPTVDPSASPLSASFEVQVVGGPTTGVQIVAGTPVSRV